MTIEAAERCPGLSSLWYNVPAYPVGKIVAIYFNETIRTIPAFGNSYLNIYYEFALDVLDLLEFRVEVEIMPSSF